MSKEEVEELYSYYKETEKELAEIKDSHKEIIDRWNTLILKRKRLLTSLKPLCAEVAAADPKEKGMVDVGPFSFSKVYNTVFNLDIMAENTDCFEILTKYSLIQVGEFVPPANKEELQLAIVDPYITVKLDESKLKALISSGEVILPPEAVTRKQSTPAQKSGPKEDYYASSK